MYALYDNITLNFSDEEVEEQIQKMSMSVFQLKKHPRYYRDETGRLVPLIPNSKVVKYERDPDNGNVLTRL